VIPDCNFFVGAFIKLLNRIRRYGSSIVLLTVQLMLSLIRLIKRFFQEVSSLGGFKLLQIVVYSLSIIAFFIGLDYFSSKPSIEIVNFFTIPNDASEIAINSLLPFYKKNDLNIPQYFQTMPRLKNLFFYEKEEDSGIGFTPPEVLEAIKKYKDFDVPNDLIKELHESVQKFKYKKGSWVFGGGRIIKKENLNKILKLLKENLTKNEHYTFLAAFIYSRVFYNQIILKNDGDIDLKDIKLLIPSPFSRVSNTRDNNILDFEPHSVIFYDIEKLENGLILQIPYLKKGDFFSFNIVSRENQIDVEEIMSNFKEDFKIYNKRKIFVGVPIVFIIMVIICICLKGKNIKD